MVTTLAAGFAAAAGVLIDRFLIDAIEVDVDAISDGERVIIGGIMQHIEQAGIPDVIPPEACCLGWQESLQLLALLVEPEIPG